ncbi:F-box protein CPR1 [Bienertia sinuspersici]
MVAFPTEIIAEILSRLPVKSLLRSSSVCKSWQSLIKSPNFVKLHLNQTLISNSNLHLLLYYPFLYSAELNLNLHHNHISFSKLHHPLEPYQVHLFGSCKGVICISDASKTDIFLFNPLTQSSFKLPLNQIPSLNPCIMSFGFGCDSKSDDYKVLWMIQGFKAGKVYEEVKLFRYNNNSWKSVEGIPFYLFDVDCHGILVNEALHYIVISKESRSQGHIIAKFDLQTETFSLLDNPKYDVNVKSNVVLTLSNLGGCLCVMANYHRDFILERADLWVMKEYGKKDSWFRLYSICQTESIGSRMQIKPIVYSKDGRRILLEIDTLEFGWYDLESKTVEKFTPHGLPDGNIETAVFVGSLVSFEDKLHSKGRSLPRRNIKKTR